MFNQILPTSNIRNNYVENSEENMHVDIRGWEGTRVERKLKQNQLLCDCMAKFVLNKGTVSVRNCGDAMIVE